MNKLLSLFLLVLLSFSASANQPPQYCTVMPGNTSVNGCLASPAYNSIDAWGSATAGIYYAAQNAAHPTYPRSWGGLSFTAFSGSSSRWGGAHGTWMNDIYPISDDWSDYATPVCPPVGGVRANPSGTVEALACPGSFNSCAPNSGQVTTHNVTAGYSRTSASVGLYVPILPNGSAAPAGYTGMPPLQMCVSGCMQTRGAAVMSWGSLEPTATGLYRQSDDWNFTNSGNSCMGTSDESAALNPAAAVPPCAGFVGQISGKTVCVPSVGNIASGTAIKPGLETVGNPTAGSTGGAANIPASGGNGANGGGPKGASDGSVISAGVLVSGPPAPGASAPTGTSSAPDTGKVNTPCGAPGQAKCAIDETGTPAAPDPGIVQAADKFKTDMDSLRSTVSGSGDKAFFSGWGTLFSAPAVVACQPVVLPAFQGGASLGSIDPCPVVDGVRSVMGYIWSLTAMIMCLGMIRRVV